MEADQQTKGWEIQRNADLELKRQREKMNKIILRKENGEDNRQ